MKNLISISNKFTKFINFKIKSLILFEEYIIQNFCYAFMHQPLYLPNVIENDMKLISLENEEVEITNLDDHILWAAPKHYRTVERRRQRRIGAMNYVCKLIPLKKLLTCLACGHPHEVGVLCPNCFKNVMKVTKSIQEAMKKADGRDPVENEYEPVFQGEKLNSKNGFFKGKRIIEIEEERPSWFAKKLTQKSNVVLSDETSPALPNPLHIK